MYIMILRLQKPSNILYFIFAIHLDDHLMMSSNTRYAAVAFYDYAGFTPRLNLAIADDDGTKRKVFDLEKRTNYSLN